MDFARLSIKFDEWQKSGVGQVKLAALTDATRITFASLNEGSYCRVYELGPEGFVCDFYPSTAPSRRGSDVVLVQNTREVFDMMWRTGDYRTAVDLENYVWKLVS